ncbi:ankyrin-2-like isoform X2 [Seriola lalandi dorsalis]|uniref:ankyrin-2-like isoform X2 n=1 Tax=Seriola lalandi dorsalis TaxID=1841481 RepID=UPI000C6FABD1|nr:ankyrin-2-like isoform X2 [Seriola lalandi dorsalis]
MQLKEPVISTGRSLSEDIQISPDRRPSEDFSADIKAELEESPEYQLFKQTSTAADVSYQLEPPERETLGDDSDMNLASFSSPRIQSYFGKGFSLMENQMRDDDLSPESSKHEGLTDSSDTSVAIRTPHSSSGDSENYEGLTLTRQMTNETLTYSAKRGEKYTIPSQEEKIHESWKDNTTITHGGKTSLTQTDTEVLDVKNEESQLKEVHTEKKTSRQESKTVKDMSGMLSLLSSDLDQYVQDRPVVSQPPEEDIVQEKFEQVILIKDKDKETLTVVTHENKGAIMDGTTKPIDHVTMAEHSITRGAEELKDEHKASNQVKDSSEMFSVINSDLDEYQEPRPVADRPIEENNVQEKFEILPSFTDENKGVTLDNTAEETDCAGFKHTVTRGGEEVVCELKVTHSNLTEELPMKEEWVEKKTSYQRSTKVKEMSGMMSLLNSDLDQYLKDRPVKTRSPEEDVIQEKFDEVVCELKETHSNLTEELPMKEEWVEKKTSYQRSTKVKEMSGMMSLLNSDLDQYLKDRPVKTRSPEEDVIQEKFDEVILTKVRKSSSEEQTITVCEKTQIVAGINVEDEIGGETYEQMQTDVVEVQELTPSSVLETPFQEVCIQKRTHQQCSTEKDMSGMLSLLSSNLDQYLKERPVTIQCHPEEDLVHESYKQVILTTKISPEHNMMSPEDTNVDIVDINEKEVLESGWQACYHEDEGPKSFLSEEGEAKLSRLSSAVSHFNDSTEGMVDLTKSYAISEDWNNDHKDVSVVPAHSVLETYTFSQLPSSFNTPRRPTDLENLNTVVFDDPAKEPCHQDSLEASPLMEDRSSKKSPDSIEPSPIGESPCPDSLEGSPTKSKDSEPQMPTKTAVYEDYASQLKACFAYDKDVYRDESEQHEQENTGENIQRESEIEEDKYSNSAMAVTDGNMSSDPKICDSENLHMLIRQDSLDTDESGDDIIHKQFTPEEEMFKMAAKIKTFEVMEQEAKMKRDASLETGDHKDDELNLTFGPVTHSSSQDTLDEISEQCVTQDTHTLIETTDITLSITEQVEIQSQLKTTGSTDSSLCLTATQREEPDPGSEEPVPLLAEREVQIHKDEDAIEGDQASLSDTHFSAGVTDEHHPEEDEVKLPPRDDSDFVSRPPTMVCAKELEYVFPGCEGDDVAFDAQVEAEKQINLFPAEDIQTPHKTPVRIPGDETSPDPFQFQEGKLFEMTRGGAIDMTRRSFDEEEEGYALPHMGEHPVDEVVPEETGEGQSVRISVTLDNSDSITDTTLQEIPKSSLTQGASDEIPTPKPRTLMTPSSKKSESEKPLSETDLGSSIEVHLGSPNALERLTNVQGEVGTLESLGLGYLDSTIADLQSDTSTVGHAVYSEQSHDSPDSSNDDDDEEEDEEDQCSVIEMCLPAAQGGIPAYHQDSPPPLAIKPSGTIKKTCHFKSEIILKDSPTFELDHVQRKAEKSSALDRRTRSEADSDTSKASKKDRRSYSDSSQSTHKSKFAPSKLPVMMQQKPLAHRISSSSPQKKEIHISKTTETSVRSSLDTDDISSASHRSPDSVIFKYEIPASHSSDSDGNPLPGVQPSSRKEDVFETRPTWDDMVETQMQRITDDHTPKLDWQDDADRKEETLAIIADLLGFSWTELARELEFSEDDIQLLRTENPNSLQEQSHALLQRWVEREGKHATEDCLIKRLTKINRMDIVHLIETQMNKSVQEQTSRTYAEIEKTLDHSEVSVALSSVQEDADSPRVVRKVESDRRPPPAVSEEDLSVASLLDIPSWAEPVGHTHSESMHGDLLEELEIPHELNPNLWTSEDIITPEPTCYDNSDEQVTTTSFKTNLSESSDQNVGLGLSQVCLTDMPPFADDSNTLFIEKLDWPIPGTFDLRRTQSEIPLTNQSSSPQEKHENLSFPKQSETSGLAKPSSVTPDSLCQTAHESPDDKIIMSSESTPPSPGSGSPQLDQLLSDLEEMKLKFRPETLDTRLSESSDESLEVDQIYMFEDLSPEDRCPTEASGTVRISVFSVIQLADDTNNTNAGGTEPEHFQASIQDESELVSVTPAPTKTPETSVPLGLGKRNDSPVSPTESPSMPESPQRCCKVMEPSLNKNGENATETFSSVSSPKIAAKSQSDIPETNVANPFEEDSTTDILQSQEECESTSTSNDTRSLKEETQSIQDQLPHLWEVTSVDDIQTEDLSSQSMSDLTPETVTSARCFSFEELIPYPSSGNFETSSDEDRPRTSGHYSEDSLTPVDFEYFQSPSVKPKAEMTSSTSDEEYSIPPGYAENSSTTSIYTHMPPGYAEVVHNREDSPTFEYSDPEPYFDCRQASSDFSETEPDEPGSRSRSSGGQPQDYPSRSRVPEKVNHGVLLSSGSEDYEDAPFVHEPLHIVHEESEELLHYSEASDEEFTLCEASQLPPVCEIEAHDDTDNSLTREITAELGSMSESSDDEFMTTRIVRRRVVIQADEMPNLPTQSVTEEKYKDENGHIVVKRVTRKIIRKCVSADGVEREEVSLEGAPQGSVSMAEGDGYSKVVKRTVVKSEGDHTEVTFTESEGFSASRQETGEGCQVSRVERTTVVEGERTMTHHGDPSLASDLPSAQDDFKQALGYISGFRRAELPHVVERETVREDGTVVRRAHMHKGRTLRRTVAKGAGKRKQVLLERVDSPRKGSKPHDLQQHLHQLFHRFYEEDKEDNDDDEEEEEEE